MDLHYSFNDPRHQCLHPTGCQLRLDCSTFICSISRYLACKHRSSYILLRRQNRGGFLCTRLPQPLSVRSQPGRSRPCWPARWPWLRPHPPQTSPSPRRGPASGGPGGARRAPPAGSGASAPAGMPPEQRPACRVPPPAGTGPGSLRACRQPAHVMHVTSQPAPRPHLVVHGWWAHHAQTGTARQVFPPCQ